MNMVWIIFPTDGKELLQIASVQYSFTTEATYCCYRNGAVKESKRSKVCVCCHTVIWR